MNNIYSINKKQISQNFQAKKEENIEENINQEIKEDTYSKNEVNGKIFVTALSAAVLGGAIMHGRNKWNLKSLKNKVSKLTENNETIKNTLQTTEEKVKNLTNDNKTLSNINRRLQEEVQKTKDKLADIFEGDIAPKDMRDKLFNELKSKIEKSDYGYDITQPPITGKGGTKVYDDAIPLPSSVGTQNRAGIKKLQIPKIASNGRFDYEFPMSDEVKITHMQSVDFKPVKLQPTNISESYADSVQWNNDKIARDILQNFFDGHGQTLDGVKLHFEPAGTGKYKVRIEGKSTYTPDKAVYIGESTKRNDAKAAGNYGEGLKMATLKLLKDGGAQDVKIASDNWKVTYSLDKGNLSDKRVLAYSLDKTEKFNGNYIEFETTDRKLLESFRKTLNRFYSSGNTHFKCPDFENEIIGIKNLPRGEKGGIYIAGQRFEFENNYDGLNNIIIFIKEKPPINVLDPSRDRTSLNIQNIGAIAKWLAKGEIMSNDDKVKLLKSLEDYWDEKGFFDKAHAMDDFILLFLYNINYPSDKRLLHIKFPAKYVAYSFSSPDVVKDLKKKGYKVCKEDFSSLGMPTIRDILGDARAHDVVIPNDIQKKKILILKEALKKLSPSLKDKHFTADELDTKIYLFDRTSAKDRKMYLDCDAEAIIDNGVSKGFWIDKSYLDKSCFSDVLETALHELSHKAGGDGSAEFSYKLTDVNKNAINQLINDVQAKSEIQALNNLWSSLQ